MDDCGESIAIVLQARMASRRLPGKVLLPILGRAMILRQLERIQFSEFSKDLVVATTDMEIDDQLASVISRTGYELFRGSCDDVLDRYYQVARQYGLSHVIRITGDCPLIDSHIIDKVVKAHIDSNSDYTSNNFPPTFPDGLDVEVMNYSTLEKCWESAKLISEREHVTLYVKNNRTDFKCTNIVADEDWSNFRWTVDEQQDLEFVRAVYSSLYCSNNEFPMEAILELVNNRPELAAINRGIKRNEGLEISLNEDAYLR